MQSVDNVVNLPETGDGAPQAPLRNVALFNRALEGAIGRPSHLPGMVVFYGPSGWGKSYAAAYAANRHRAYYVEAKSTWTRKAFLLSLLKEMGIQPASSNYEMVDQIAEQLVLSERPLIIDEMDHLVEKKAVEVIRDIYEGSNAAIMLVGEERMPGRLKVWERFHNRILEWQAAQPCTLQDAALLAQLYSDVRIGQALLSRIHDLSRGAARRIAVNIERVRQCALAAGKKSIDISDMNGCELYMGEPPRRKL